RQSAQAGSVASRGRKTARIPRHHRRELRREQSQSRGGGFHTRLISRSMNASFWQRIHGGSTHFPIVLVLASVVFDFIAWRSRDEVLRRGLHAAGLGSAVVGMLGGIGAVVAGLIMTRGRMLGGGYEKTHHLFVWPAFTACIVFVGWRLFKGGRISQRGLGAYLSGMSLAAALMVGAGYSGGEMLLAAEKENDPASARSNQPTSTSAPMPLVAA